MPAAVTSGNTIRHIAAVRRTATAEPRTGLAGLREATRCKTVNARRKEISAGKVGISGVTTASVIAVVSAIEAASAIAVALAIAAVLAIGVALVIETIAAMSVIVVAPEIAAVSVTAAIVLV
jgi:hypothetical protein